MGEEGAGEAPASRLESENALARRAQSGDQAAFLELYADAAPALYAWASLRLGGKHFASVDPGDVVQEVWVRALDRLDTYDPKRSFRGWLIGIAKHVVLQLFEQGSRRGQTGTPLESRVLREAPDPVTTICSRLGRMEVLARFFGFIEGLGPEDRLLVILCGLEERTCAEAAQQLNISADAATKRWQVMRARMRSNGALQAFVGRS